MGIRAAALAYSLLLGGTAAFASDLSLAQPRYFPVALGAALFLFSDVVLAIEAYRGPIPVPFDLVWATYGPGQVLIVWGMNRKERSVQAGSCDSGGSDTSTRGEVESCEFDV